MKAELKPKSIADRLFDSVTAEGEISNAFERMEVPYEYLGWDQYDGSLELKEVPVDYRLSEEAQRFCFDCGFHKVYVNHVDGWETHYNFLHSAEFTPQSGWRVSYPRKRGESAGAGILVEQKVDSWPSDWFETGYAKVSTAEPDAVP